MVPFDDVDPLDEVEDFGVLLAAGGSVAPWAPGCAPDADWSAGGASFVLSSPLEAPHAYLHWQHKEGLAPFAVLTRVVRVQPVGDEKYEVGTHFPGAEPDR